MIELITISMIFFIVGYFIYSIRFRNKEKPKAGVKRNSNSEYLNDYLELKLYWGSIFLIIFGLTVLTIILLIELFDK